MTGTMYPSQAGEEIISAPEAPMVPPMFAKEGIVDAAERAEPGPRDKLLNKVVEDSTGVSEAMACPGETGFRSVGEQGNG